MDIRQRFASREQRTARLILRPPHAADVDAIFTRFASDPDVTRYVAWPRHKSMADSAAFVDWSEAEWRRWPAGPLLMLSASERRLLGTTGLAFETPERASTGYVLARDAWGQGYATEALSAITDFASALDVRRLYALCHAEHRASARVLEKCGFAREGLLRRHTAFPNLGGKEPCDVLCYARLF